MLKHEINNQRLKLTTNLFLIFAKTKFFVKSYLNSNNFFSLFHHHHHHSASFFALLTLPLIFFDVKNLFSNRPVLALPLSAFQASAGFTFYALFDSTCNIVRQKFVLQNVRQELVTSAKCQCLIRLFYLT